MKRERLRDYAERPWPVRYRLVKWLHGKVNRLAWRYACPVGDEAFARSANIDHGHVLWRLNDWLASKWVPWWMRHG